ncbi:hypothetical protein PENSPDRAFT_87119 [Peniophora sp. CONT]|nr:hypothetical protein PENSPDRAFT_87119 [Peniophora sp. CONT]
MNLRATYKSRCPSGRRTFFFAAHILYCYSLRTAVFAVALLILNFERIHLLERHACLHLHLCVQRSACSGPCCTARRARGVEPLLCFYYAHAYVRGIRLGDDEPYWRSGNGCPCQPHSCTGEHSHQEPAQRTHWCGRLPRPSGCLFVTLSQWLVEGPGGTGRGIG